jgi:uncharacterized protein
MATTASQSGNLSSAVTEEKVWTALERLIEAADPVKIVAFGSRANGTAREGSDLDLAVILPADTVLPDTSLWATVSGLGMTVDLMVTNETVHERMRKSINSVHYDIETEGIVLYRKDTNGGPDRAMLARLCTVREPDIDELRKVWQQAMTNAGSGTTVEELFDRLEQKYRALADLSARKR